MTWMRIFTFLFLMSCLTQLHAQRSGTTKTNMYDAAGLFLNVGYGMQFPAGDMANRFGRNGNGGIQLEYKTNKNWLLGAEWNYIFGARVKEDPLKYLRSPDGYIYSNERTVASVVLRERGFYGGLYVGKWFPKSHRRSASGPRFTVGAGMLQHKIRVQDDSRRVNQLMGDYIKGYDRLSNGFALNESIGWQMLSRGGANFCLSFEAYQGFTENQRSYDFELMQKLDEKRVDLLFGIRATWILQLRSYLPSEEIYY